MLPTQEEIETLKKLYLVDKLNYTQISSLTGFSYGRIQKYFKIYGVPIRRRYLDLTGYRFGRLSVVRLDHTDGKGQALWLCHCDCGNQKIIRATSLKCKKPIKSCGCAHRKGHPVMGSFYFHSIRNNSKSRELEFNINVDDIWQLYVDQKGKCALSGIDIVFKSKNNSQTASLDRIDSSKGYTKDNIQWVHKDVNWLKGDLSDKDVLIWAERIYLFNKNKYPVVL